MIVLSDTVNVCDYGDETLGGCLKEKTFNSPKDAIRHELAICNGCSREHNCAVIPRDKLRLRDGVQFTVNIQSGPRKSRARRLSMRENMGKTKSQ